MNRQAYETDLSNISWELLAPLIPAEKRGGRHRSVAMREVLNAIFYILRSGCAWRLLPHDFSAWQTVFGYFSRWCSWPVETIEHGPARDRARTRGTGRRADGGDHG